MQIGKLTFSPVREVLDLVAKPIQQKVRDVEINDGVYATAIDPEHADTTSFCETYDITRDIATNCIIVEAKRADRTWYAACLILADDMIDINGKVRRRLDARKISFAPKDTALILTQMEYGGITPLGLPVEWPILIDEKILLNNHVVVGGGIRGSKILVSTKVLATLDNSYVLDIKRASNSSKALSLRLA